MRALITRRFSLKGGGIFLALSLIWAAPLWWLLHPSLHFNEDWDNLCWSLSYQAKSLAAQGSLTEVFHTQSQVAIPSPVFYGNLLYPLLAPLSCWLGAALSLRLFLAVVTGVETWLLWRASQRAGFSLPGGLAFVASVVGSVYGLTDLYSRSAIPEFLALSLLGSAAALLFTSLVTRVGWQRSRDFWFAGLCLILAAGIHVPTLVMTGFGLSLAILGLLVLAPGPLLRGLWHERGHLCLLGGLFCVVMAPWIQAMLLCGRHLLIANTIGELVYFPLRCDSWLGRFLPLGHDVLCLTRGTGGQQTPYLDAPMSTPLLLLLFGLGSRLAIRRFSASYAAGRTAQGWWLGACLLGVSLFSSALATVLSLIPSVSGRLCGLAPSVQFAYRWVGPANVALAFACLLLGVLLGGTEHSGDAKPRGSNRSARYWIGMEVLLLVFALALVPLKLKRAVLSPLSERAAVGQPAPSWSVLTAQLWPTNGFNDYATVRSWPEVESFASIALQTVHLDLDETALAKNSAGFPQVGSNTVYLKEAAWVRTNVLAFDWSELCVDGQPVPKSDYAVADDAYFCVHLPRGDHQLTWVWHPPKSRGFLLGMARTGLFALLAVSLWHLLPETFWRAIRRRRE